MRHRMVSDRVAFCFHPPDQVLILRNKIPDNKKDSRSLMLFQCIQNRRCISIFISGIKGKIEFLFLCIFGKEGIILG